MSEKFEALKAKDEQFVCRNYGRYPLAIAHGEGCRLYDLDGKEYIDLLAGLAVNALGHAHPKMLAAMETQAAKLMHVSNLFYTEEQADLAEKLIKTCAADKVFFCNSGAEANEAAIKMARKYMQTIRKRDAYEIVTLEGSFHGRTLATMTATGNPAIKEGFAPLPEGFRIVPFGDLQAVKDAVGPQTAGVLIECIQGEGGINILPEGYIEELAAFCKEQDILLIIDEIQTGLCRTGKYWAHQHFGVEPDIFTAAKPLAGGLPIGAVLAKEEIAKAFSPGTHGTTFGGNPFVCGTALAVMDVMEHEGMAERAASMGAFALDEFRKLQAAHPSKIAQVRGLGLMLAVELSFPGQEVWQALLDKGFILNLTRGTVLRLLPPLVVEEADILAFCSALDETLAATNAPA
jgi:acetylornithine aminotransferase